jgi:hypothetical protein
MVNVDNFNQENNIKRFGATKTSLTLSHLIKVPVSNQEIDRSCIYLRGNDFASFCHFSIG